MEINPLRSPDAAAAAPQGGTSPATSEVSFKDLLADALAQVNQLQQNADAAAVQAAAGAPIGVDEVMVAVQKADLALQLTIQVRNKLVEAYQDITRMQI